MNEGANDSVVDVAVIGAGPAGATAARAIAQRGASVALIDKAIRGRDKACGCCLSDDALTTLDRLGLGELTHRLDARRLDTLQLATPGRSARIPLPRGAAISRGALDAALIDAAQDRGTIVHQRTHASLLGCDGDAGVQLLLRNGRTRWHLGARVLVVADGVGGRLLEKHEAFTTRIQVNSHIGVSAMLDSTAAVAEPGTIHMACANDGYVGLVGLEDGRVNIAAALDPRFIKHMRGPTPAAKAILERVGWPAPSGLDGATWHGTAQLTRRRRPLTHRNIFLLGDAAGYVEPFTGEGIAWALRTGEMVADLAVSAAREGWRDSVAAAWTARYRQHIEPRQRRCSWVASALRSPMAMRALVAAAAHWPGMSRTVVQAITTPPRSTRRPAPRPWGQRSIKPAS